MKTELKIKVTGMHCGSCAKLIEDALSKLEGVEETKVSLEDDIVQVSFDSDQISKEVIEEALKGLGYPPEGASKSSLRPNTIRKGIIYGLVPHIGCIGFIVASVLSVTVAVEFFKPLLMNPWFFHILILLSIGFATLSSAFYLKKNGLLSLKGIKKKKKYLTAMYGSTVGINLILFFVIFPMLANLDTGSFANTTGNAITGNVVLTDVNNDNVNLQVPEPTNDSLLTLQVDIPCPGHAPLISGELKTIQGVTGVRYKSPNYFDVAYDSAQTSKTEILSLEVFDVYPATITFESESSGPEKISLQENEVRETTSLAQSNDNVNSAESCDGSCGGTGSCGLPTCGCSAK